MKKSIYFADLTYESGGILSCDYFPLGCGYVAAYIYSLFSSSCEIKLFKYIDEIMRAVEKNPPDIFAGSCYAWNRNLSLLVSQLIKKRHPECLIVLGGTAFPQDTKRQQEFLLKNRFVDFFIPYDGELSFENLIKRYFAADNDKIKMKELPIAGIIYLNNKNEIVVGENTKRPKDIDIFPSPYLSGLFDRFFEGGRLTPLIQTTRGCPYTCSYCWASNEQNISISFFSVGRVIAELNYIAQLATKNNMYDLLIADSNFGLFEKDYRIVETLYHLQETHNYPQIFCVPYAQKAGYQNFDCFSKLKGTSYSLAIQSTDYKILQNVKRRSIDLKSVSEYINAVHRTKKHVGTEIILGLPLETRQTHLKTLRDLLDCGFDLIEPFTFMLLDGIELDSDEAHKKFQYDIRYRLIPRDFGKIDGNYSFEIEKVVVGTSTYNLQDYIYLRGIHGLLYLLVNNGVYRELLQYVRQYGIHLLDWIIFIFDDLRLNASKASNCFAAYMDEIPSELWNSPEDILQYYSKEENYRKLLTRERGDNLLQKYLILGSSIYFDIYVDYFVQKTRHYLEEKHPENKQRISSELSDIKKFIQAKLSNVIVKNIQRTEVFNVENDITQWIRDGFKSNLSEYKLENPKTVVVELSEGQMNLINSVFKRYEIDANNPYGLYRASALVRIDSYFRTVQDAKRGANLGQSEISAIGKERK